MVWIYGVVNGIGVVLLVFIGWVIEKSVLNYKYYGKLMSKLRGNVVIGEVYLYSNNLVDSKEYNGLVDKVNDFYSEVFDVMKVFLSMIYFYENIIEYEL